MGLGTDVNVESTYILDAQQRTAVTVDAFPVGIDCAHFQSLLATRELKDKVRHLPMSPHISPHFSIKLKDTVRHAPSHRFPLSLTHRLQGCAAPVV